MATGDAPFPLDDEARLVIKLLRAAAAKCVKLIRNPPGKTAKTQSWHASAAAQQLQSINKQLDQVKGKLANVAAKKIAAAYQNGINAAEQHARDAGIRPSDSPGVGSFNQVDRRRAQKLAQQAVGDLSQAVESIRKTTGHIVKQTQARGLDRAQLNTLLAGGTIQGQPRETLRDLKKMIRDIAAGPNGEGGKIVTVNTKTGVIMHFKPDDYAELVFQTKLAETTNVATVERLKERGILYVKIIGSNSRNFCTAFVNRAFYTGDGADPLGKFLNVRDLPRGGPPFHPRCTKRFVAFVPGMMTPEQIEAARLKPNEVKVIEEGRKGSNAAQKVFEKTLPIKPASASPPTRKPSTAAKTVSPAKPAKPKPRVTREVRDPDDEPVLVGRMDDSGNMVARFAIANQEVAQSASRAWERCVKAGYQPPRDFMDAPDLSIFQGTAGEGNMAAYAAIPDVVLINPNTPRWRNVKEVMKDAYSRKHASSDDPDHIMIHEIGHYVHRHAVGLDRYRAIRQQQFTSAQRELVSRHVSHYAATQPVEMVAEVFAAKIAGRVFAPEIMDLYKLYGGI